MDDKFRSILNSLPPKQQRSRLEPYSDLVNELRRRGRTFREIARILGEKCEVMVASSTLVRFVASRSRAKRKESKFLKEEGTLVNKGRRAVPEKAVTDPNPSPMDDGIRRRIEALKQRTAQSTAPPKQFKYDPDEPLQLVRIPGKDESGKNA
jgi:hypothetical protein